MSGDEVKTILALLVQLAKADGVVDLREDMFIKLYAHNHSVDPGEFDRICRSPEMYAGNLSVISDKEDVFARLCAFVYFDMNASQSELDWCRNVGRQLYLKTENVEKAMTAIQTSASPLSVDEIKEIVRNG